MDKLVKLLNEYHFSGTEYVGYYLDEKENRIYFRTKVIDKGLIDEQRISDERIISKKFGFIERLVKKDKIDLQKVMERNKNGYDITRVNPDDNFIDNAIEYDDELDLFIIMLLAISDEPLQFLISILK